MPPSQTLVDIIPTTTGQSSQYQMPAQGMPPSHPSVGTPTSTEPSQYQIPTQGMPPSHPSADRTATYVNPESSSQPHSSAVNTSREAPQIPSAPPSAASPQSKLAQLQFDFTAANPWELSVRKEDIVDVLLEDGEWIKVRHLGKEGFVPRAFLH
jgi:hypothetical protein